MSYDAWGNRRDPNTWRAFTSTPEEPLFDRGFTGHEHLYAFNLINMNGRFYDPIIGRMLSPDNFMQAPDYTQSFNRYSYCWNNPLKYTDPSGEFIWGVVAFITIGAYEMWKPGGWDGWKSSGQNSVNAGINGLLFGGNAPVTPTNLIKYSGSILANRFIADNINLSITSGNWTFSTTQGLGIGANGKLTYNFFGTIVFDDGETNFGFGFGKASNMFALGGHIRKSNGGGIGYYYTHYGNQKGYDGKSNKQNVAGFQFYWKGGSFRWENDVFAWQHQDKYRSNAMEFEIDGFVFGCSIYNNDPAGDKQKRDNRPSPTFGFNQSGEGSWEDGQTYMAPFWIGFKMGNNITRFGYSHWLVQDLTQNFMHQQSFFKPGNQAYYLEYNNLYEGRWAYQGYYNPFSLYNH
jgi:RHS repeat-associated protein